MWSSPSRSSDPCTEAIGVVVRVVAAGDLAGDLHLVAGDARAPNRLADLASRCS